MATPLTQRHCVVCEPGTPTLSRPEIDKLLGQLDGWVVEQADGHFRLGKTIRFKGFLTGVELVNQISQVAEQEGHHPDLHLSYGALKVELWTHTAGGLTENDFVLAAKIDQLQPGRKG